MFVVIADQVASRGGPDAVEPVLDELRQRYGERLTPGPERTAGDEFETVTADPDIAIDLVLQLGRGESWRLGLGIGPVQLPLAASTRASRGVAFIEARAAIERARRRRTRFAAGVAEGSPFDGGVIEGLIDPVLVIRAERSDAGWELAELLDTGCSQAEAARRLGISQQAVSQRALAAGLALERAAVPALERVLAVSDVWDSVVAQRNPTGR